MTAFEWFCAIFGASVLAPMVALVFWLLWRRGHGFGRAGRGILAVWLVCGAAWTVALIADVSFVDRVSNDVAFAVLYGLTWLLLCAPLVMRRAPVTALIVILAPVCTALGWLLLLGSMVGGSPERDPFIRRAVTGDRVAEYHLVGHATSDFRGRRVVVYAPVDPAGLLERRITRASFSGIPDPGSARFEVDGRTLELHTLDEGEPVIDTLSLDGVE